jgi:dTDP-4-amino-4,6-dideoxygalactose transaminase
LAATKHIPMVDVAASLNDIGAAVVEVCDEVMRSGSYVGGRYVEAFETQWADYCDRDYAVGVGNGTDALQLTLRALGVSRGDEVILPTNTFIATAEAVVRAGAIPVFVDVDERTALLTADLLSASITSRTAAVIAVHLYGQPCDMDAIGAVAARAQVPVIEDAAQAHGAQWAGRKVGSFGVASCFSFYPTKNLGAAGDAGAVVTNDCALASRIRSLSNHGRSESDANWHVVDGGNSRLDAMQAAILSLKLPHLDAWTKARSVLADVYREHLAPASAIGLIAQAPEAISAHHLQVVRVKERARVREYLTKHGVATGVHYPVPCHRQPIFGTCDVRLPVAEAAADEVLSLPLFPQLPEDTVEFVASTLLDAVAGAARNERGGDGQAHRR